MIVLIIGSVASSHISRLANLLDKEGAEVHIATIHKGGQEINSSIKIHKLPNYFSLGYFIGTKKLRSIIRKIEPNVIDVHYMSGYGTLASLSLKKGTYIGTVWGSDVYDFPYRSRIHNYLVKMNLSRAKMIVSTSKAMSNHVSSIVSSPKVLTIPFGVDTRVFAPCRSRSRSRIRIGIVKSLHKYYGIDTLIKAFYLVKRDLPNYDIELIIIGSGEEKDKLILLSKSLNLLETVKFIPAVKNKDVPLLLNSLDIFCCLSNSESFGVSILEACACSLPVIVSDAVGPKEIVLKDKTGIVVPKKDPYRASLALKKLVINKDLRKFLGSNARKHIIQNYSAEKSIQKTIDNYRRNLLEGV